METPTPSSPPRRGNIAAGVKRPAPEPLLPAFDFTSSPPKLPPAKRQARSPSSDEDARQKYPTPMPTSSLGFDIRSSPPQLPQTRPQITRTMSSVSERAPLSALPTLTPSVKGEAMLLGRSSISCDHQLSSNRLISRVHVKVTYISDPFNPRIEIVCVGWNGIKVHCQSHAWELAKGDTFSTTQEGAEILIDVQDARVAIAWPRVQGRLPVNLGRSPSRSKAGMVWNENDENVDPIRRSRERLGDSPFSRSGSFGKIPISPASSRSGNAPLLTSDFLHSENTIQVYEDRSDPSEEEEVEDDKSAKKENDNASFELPQIPSRAASPCPTEADENDDNTSELDQLSSSLFNDSDEPEHDQENSQGPAFSFVASSSALPRMPPPPRGRKRVRSDSSPAPPSRSQNPTDAEIEAVKNHATNQLAFSRLSSTPLSTVMEHLPPSITKHPLSNDKLAEILQNIECIGVIQRKGKDAAGKPLESQYYYIPDKDMDDARRGAVTEGLRKPGLRACRKVHKQYFWRKPKMPSSHHH